VSSPQLDAPPRSASPGRTPGRAHPLRPTALEIAAGYVWGEERQDGGGPIRAEDAQTPLAALEDVVLPALGRPPCLVSFSGGRDSSLVLAATTRAARREGLELPIPITNRYRDAPRTEESSWQELMIDHLGLSDWEIRVLGDEADWLGPISTTVLRRHGVLFPPNAFLHLTRLEAARGGSLLSGVWGDQIFATWRWQAFADVLARRRGPKPRDARRLAYLVFPPPLRRAWERRQQRRQDLPWLRPEAKSAVESSIARERAAEPASWAEWVGWLARRRELAVGCSSLRLLAEDVGARLVLPLIEPRFLAAIARVGGRVGLGERTAAMRALFAEVLPRELITRPTKAVFNEALWRTHTRAFAESWDGAGLDEELVDPAALREEWLSPSPDFRSAMLLQSAWLSRQRRVDP
jgi:asparagine synthase